MRKLFLFLILFNFIFAQEIIFTVTTEKDTFLVAEPVWLCLRVENHTPDSLYVNFGESLEKAIVTDSRGERINCISTSWYFVPIYCNAGPGDTYEEYNDLLGYYNHSGWGTGVFLLKEGTYTVEMKFHPQMGWSYRENRAHKKVYKTVSAEPVTFHVVEPSGFEKNVFENYKKIMRLLRNKETQIEGYNNLLDLVNKFPESLYNPTILYSLKNYHPNKYDKDEFKIYVMSFINKYPNSHYIKSIMLSLNARYRRVEDRESFIQIMDEIIQQHPDTEASRVAERWRKYAQTAPDDEWDNKLKSKKLRKMIEEHKKLLKKRGIE